MVFVSIRIFARFKVFKRLYVDDALVIFALTLVLASAIIWQILAKKMYQFIMVNRGEELPPPNFITDAEDYLRATLAISLFYFSTLWAIKISFLIFFKRLIKNVRRQELMWWPILGFTVATYFACIGTIPYKCLGTVPLQQAIVTCTKDSTIKSHRISLLLKCAWDVITDFLSPQTYFVLCC